MPRVPRGGALPPSTEEQGSIIIVVATDAPLLPHQLERVARRATMGLARTGATSGNGSGDIFLAFSTANDGVAAAPREIHVNMLSNSRISALFSATVEATEEAIINALIGAETMTGVDGRKVEAIPHDRVQRADEEVRALTLNYQLPTPNHQLGQRLFGSCEVGS